MIKATIKFLITATFLMVAFSSYGFDRPVKYGYCLADGDIKPIKRYPLGQLSLDSPQSACGAAGLSLGPLTNSTLYGRCGGTTGWQCLSSNGTYNSSIDPTAYAYFITPPNSTCTSTTCACNTGYAEKDGNSCALDENNNGTPDIDEPPECPNNLTKNPQGVCSCNDINKPHERYNVSDGLSCQSTTSNQDQLLAALIAASAGLSLSSATGLFAGLAACLASVICAAGLSLATLGALLAAAGLTIGDAGAPTPSEPSPLIVKLPPSPQTTRSPDEVILNPGGSTVPPSNSTDNGDGTFNYDTGTGTVKINPEDSTVINTRNNPDGSTTTTTIKNTPNGAQVTSVKSKPFGTTSTGSPVKEIETSKININPNSTSSETSEKSIAYESGGVLSPNPPLGTVPSTGTGTGTGEGEGEGEGETGQGGDCDKEPVKCSILTNINNTLNGVGTDGTLVLSQLNTKLTDGLDDYYDTAQGLVDGFLASDLWADEFLSAMSNTPNPFTYLGSKAGNCTYQLNILENNYPFSICEYLTPIHSAFAFGTFILLMFGIRDLVFEKETT